MRSWAGRGTPPESGEGARLGEAHQCAVARRVGPALHEDPGVNLAQHFAAGRGTAEDHVVLEAQRVPVQPRVGDLVSERGERAALPPHLLPRDEHVEVAVGAHGRIRVPPGHSRPLEQDRRRKARFAEDPPADPLELPGPANQNQDGGRSRHQSAGPRPRVRPAHLSSPLDELGDAGRLRLGCQQTRPRTLEMSGSALMSSNLSGNAVSPR